MRGRSYSRAGAAIYRTQRWAAVRKQAKDRDDWKCVTCGNRGRLEVDHIVAIRDGGAPYDLSNLQTLCVRCHSRKTRLEMGFPDKSPERKEWDALLKKKLPDF
ncbi:HNH endonuclease [Qingshengfaniella alkalisoli]|uniref:Putative HNH nuclease YajD n=1 Tax=Qingshengfaniella alkalisoli TaxID=2599296 RepID=A0A5B8IXJ2_9RHOB|nr:HNH endonuclease [Qingshengfaniella alkalisoli]QDY69318.1 HNH endonuclease [Qingshengfaniella alkalisoli]